MEGTVINTDRQDPTFQPLNPTVPEITVSRSQLHKWNRVEKRPVSFFCCPVDFPTRGHFSFYFHVSASLVSVLLWQCFAVHAMDARRFNFCVKKALFPRRMCGIERGTTTTQLEFVQNMLNSVNGGNELTSVDCWNILHHGRIAVGDNGVQTVYSRCENECHFMASYVRLGSLTVVLSCMSVTLQTMSSASRARSFFGATAINFLSCASSSFLGFS